MLFCSYGDMSFRLPGRVCRCDVDFVKCKQKVFPLSGKVVFIWGKNYHGHRDLACQQARSRYPRNGKTTYYFIMSKCFLGNRDNFCPYEHAGPKNAELAVRSQ